MYKLYNVKTWGSLAIHCLLEELEAPYTNIWMTREQVREPEFRAINPLGMIPALGLAEAAIDDGSGDTLDAIACAMLAAWAAGLAASGYGLPDEVDPIEGWIVGA